MQIYSFFKCRVFFDLFIEGMYQAVLRSHCKKSLYSWNLRPIDSMEKTKKINNLYQVGIIVTEKNSMMRKKNNDYETLSEGMIYE